MSPRLPSEFLPTVGVSLVVAFVAGARLSPPDPSAQLLYVGPGVVLSVLVAALLTHVGGYRRLGLSPTGRDHRWTVAGILAAVVLALLLVPNPTVAAPNAAILLFGVLVGAWLGYGRGRERPSFRSRNA